MSHCIRYRLLLLLLISSWSISMGFSQMSFNMRDTIVTECKGRLFDNGGPGANYSHNANLTFTICVNQTAPITLNFLSFCVEAGFDSLRIFDGPNMNSPQLGPTLTGNSIPAPVTALSGCMTLNFRSDANVACFGWIADWSTEIIPPIPPNITASTALPACNQTVINVNFSNPVKCDSVYAGVFSISGPANATVVNAQALSCNQGLTSGASLTLNPGLTVGGSYQVVYTYRHLDACDSLWLFQRTFQIDIFDCPIEVIIIAEQDSLCADQCTYLSALASGGNGQYTFSWSNGLPPTFGPHLVCPVSNTTYTVTVDDTSPALPASASKSITLFPKTIAGNDLTLCQSDDPLQLNGSPLDGFWSGSGIIDQVQGIFDPDSANPGLNLIQYAYFYSSNFFCADTMFIDLRPISAGFDEAACPGSDPFQLTGNIPEGGTWSGLFTNSTGLFDPQAQGAYEITYTFNGCSDVKMVFVDFITNVPAQTDSICQSEQEFAFALQPPGGVWTGNGITDPFSGIFSADEAGGGLHLITYAINGCNAQFDIFVKAIDAGSNFFACPSQEFIQITGFSPTGGVWSGNGIIDPINGLFNPAFNNGNANATLTYTLPNGCEDQIIARVRQTVIGEDLLRFCVGDDALNLNNDNTSIVPPNGVWTGAGTLTGPQNTFLFNPEIAGQGVFTLTYSANTCSDTMQVIVYDEMLIAVENVCELNPPFELPLLDYAAGGQFSGTGITNSDLGIFAPTVAGVGSHIITYTSPNGCTDQIAIEVGNFAAAIISPVDPQCFRDTLIALSAQPPGGIFSGPGVIANSFNPLLADAGLHTIQYIIGEGFCQATSTTDVLVFPRVNFTSVISRDTLCAGDFANIQVNAFGGNGSLITFQWNNELPAVSQQIVNPSTSTNYIVTISDGCTVVNDTFAIFVANAIEYTLTVNDIKCFGDPSTASIEISDPNLNIIWRRGNQTFTGNTLNGQAGTPYGLEISDPVSGCKKDTIFTLPAHPPVIANFLINPNSAQCLEFDQRFISLIDQSSGGLTGSWDMGDQTTYSYEPFFTPSHEFTEPGEFNVNLLIFDANGCKSDHTERICILDKRAVYIPNTFTPNADGLNDVLQVFGTGIRKIDVYVYDRRGILLAHATELGDVWDGKRPDGRPAMIDVYAYLIELTWESGQFFTRTGTVTLKR
ncbi:MAG: gliding motility-associated C-terminal domain-containing protein [Flavobacteriales bacterium]